MYYYAEPRVKVFSAMKVALFGNICQTGNLVQTSKVHSFGLK